YAAVRRRAQSEGAARDTLLRCDRGHGAARISGPRLSEEALAATDRRARLRRYVRRATVQVARRTPFVESSRRLRDHVARSRKVHRDFADHGIAAPDRDLLAGDARDDSLDLLDSDVVGADRDR